MIHLLERLLVGLGVPVVPGLLVLGCLPVVVGAWVRLQWRPRHDLQLRIRRAEMLLARRFRRDPRTVRSLHERLRREVGWDLGRWVVATLAWLAVLLGWAACAVGLLRGAYVRDQLQRTLEHVPVPIAVAVYALWCGGLVVATRWGRDRAALGAPQPMPRGLWPSLTRALVPLFCSIGITALLVDQDGYPLGPALIATALPGAGLLVFGALHDRFAPVASFTLPDWLVRLEPRLAPRPTTRETPTLSRRQSSAEPARRPRSIGGSSGAGTVASSAWRTARARSAAATAVLRDRIAQARPAVLGVAPAPPASGATRAWSALAPQPTPLTSRDPRRLGPYQIEGRIGSGGMATVYRGVHRSGQTVALKVPRPGGVVADPTQQRLAAEIATLSRLDIPGVVRIREAATDEDLLWVAMDYLRGPTLDRAVREVGPLTEAAALRALAGRTARALAGLHRAGVTHRDVKPGNLILTDAGPVLVDLGIAKVEEATVGLTTTGAVVGSVGYLPPEAHRNRPYGHTADVWAWACCVVLAASGRALFPGQTTHEVLFAVANHRPDRSALDELRAVDSVVAEVVERCIAPDPRQRPADGAELLTLLPAGGAWPGPDLVTRTVALPHRG